MTAAETVPAEVGLPIVTPAPRTTRQKLISLVRLLISVAVIAGVAYTTTKQWTEVKHYLLSIPWQSAVLALVMILIGLGAGAMGWRAAIKDLGHEVSVRSSSQIYLIGLLGKYLPGSIWAYLLQMELGQRAGLPRSRAFLASIVLAGVGTTVALCFGVFGFPALLDVGGAAVVALAVLLPVSLVCAYPKVLTWLVQQFLRILRRPPLEEPITWRGVGAVAGWSAVTWIAYGIQLWLLANSQGAPGLEGLLSATGAFALGMTAGLFAFLVPSGLGVREAVIVAALLPYVPTGTALGMALASRMLFVIGDLLAAFIAALSALPELRAARAARAAAKAQA
jgi:uncharacterized membrane protein YbhN (UPF0104 family)